MPQREDKIKIATLVIVYLLLLAGIAGAATRLATPDGSNLGDCTGTPCTLNRAISEANCGDTISLGNGTYSNTSQSLTLSCPISNRVTMQAANCHEANIRGTYSYDGADTLTLSGDGWILECLQITRGDINLDITGTASNNIIRDNFIIDMARFAVQVNGSNNQIRDNVIGYHHSVSGMHAESIRFGNGGHTLENNAFISTNNKTDYILNDDAGVHIGSFQNDITAIGNYIIASHQDGFRCRTASRNIARDNIFAYNHASAMNCRDNYVTGQTADHTIQNNFFYNNVAAIGGKGQPAGGITIQDNTIVSGQFSMRNAFSSVRNSGEFMEDVDMRGNLIYNPIGTNVTTNGMIGYTFNFDETFSSSDGTSCEDGCKTHNLWWSNSPDLSFWFDYYTGSGGQGPWRVDSSEIVDYANGRPQFIDEVNGNFFLASGSPGRGADHNQQDMGVKPSQYMTAERMMHVKRDMPITEQAVNVSSTSASISGLDGTNWYRVYAQFPSSDPCTSTNVVYEVEGASIDGKDYSILVNGESFPDSKWYGGQYRWVTVGDWPISSDGVLNISWNVAGCVDRLAVVRLPTPLEAHQWIRPELYDGGSEPPPVSLLDDFNRADESLDVSANWTADIAGQDDSCAIDTNKVIPPATSCANWWSSATFDAPQEVYGTLDIPTDPATSRLYMCLQGTIAGSVDGYRLEAQRLASDLVLRAQRMEGGSSVQLGADFDIPLTGVTFPEEIRMTVDNSGNLEVFLNGVSQFTRTDPTPYDCTGTNLGLQHNNNTGSTWDDFGGGTMVVGGGGAVTPYQHQGDFLTLPGCDTGNIGTTFYPTADSTDRATCRSAILARDYKHLYLSVVSNVHDYYNNASGFNALLTELTGAGINPVVWLTSDTGAWKDQAISAIIDDLEAFIPQIDANVDSYVLGIEIDEYWSLSEANQVATAMQSLTNKPIGFHQGPYDTQGSGSYDFCAGNALCDYMVLQYGTAGLSTGDMTTITNTVISALGTKPLVAGEYNVGDPEATSISLGDAAIAAGASGFGNGGTAFAGSSDLSGVITVAATCTDNVGVQQVCWEVDGIQLPDGCDATPPYTSQFVTNYLSNGEYTLTARCTDTSQNEATDSVVINVSNAADETDPVVAISSPTAGDVSGTVSIEATCTDNVACEQVQFYIGQTLLATVSAGAFERTAFSANWNTSTAGSGSFTIRTVATDYDGNTHEDTVEVNISGEIFTADIEDAWICSSPVSCGVGDGITIFTRWQPGVIRHVGIIKIDVSGSSFQAVDSAFLHLNAVGVSGTPSVDAMTASSNNWSENTVSWQNAPTFGSVLDTQVVSTVGDVAFDITSAINTALAGNGITTIYIATTTQGTDAVHFDAKEGGFTGAIVTLNEDPTQTPDITTGLVGHWILDEGTGTTATDSSGQAHHGTISEEDWTTQEDKACLMFDGTGSYVDLGQSTDYDGIPELTFTARVFPTTTSGSTRTIAGFSGPIENRNWQAQILGNTTGQGQFTITNGTAFQSLNSESVVIPNEWQTIAVRYRQSGDVIPPFPTTPVLDNFNRGDEIPLGGGNWTSDLWLFDTGCNLTNNEVSNPGTACGSWWSSQTYSAPQEVHADITLNEAPNTSRLFFCMQPGTIAGDIDGYSVDIQRFETTHAIRVRRMDNGQAVQLGTDHLTDLADVSWPESLGVRIDPSGKIDVYLNGEFIFSPGTDTTYSCTDTNIGLNMNNAGGNAIDNFGGGNAAATTPILDNFNRADESPLANGNWTSDVRVFDTGCDLTNNQATNPGTACASWWSAETFDPPIEVYGDFVLNDAPNVSRLSFCLQPGTIAGATDGYELYIQRLDTTRIMRLNRIDDGSEVAVGDDYITPIGEVTFPENVRVRMSASGLVDVYINGSYAFTRGPDTTYDCTGTNIGLNLNNAGGNSIDNFGGGTAVVGGELDLSFVGESVSQAASIDLAYTAKNFYLGALDAGALSPFIGCLRDVRIYTRRLNANELNAVFLADP